MRRIGFLLVTDFSLIAFSSAFDTLRMANRMREEKIYEWRVLTQDGQPVSSSSGLTITPDGDIGAAAGLDMLFVCSGDRVHLTVDRSLLDMPTHCGLKPGFLRQAQRPGGDRRQRQKQGDPERPGCRSAGFHRTTY